MYVCVDLKRGTVTHRVECRDCKYRQSIACTYLPNKHERYDGFCPYFTEMVFWPGPVLAGRRCKSCGSTRLIPVSRSYPRPPTFTERQLDEMVRRYNLGQSLSQLARAMHCEKTTVKNHLVKRGVKLRSKGGIKGKPKTRYTERDTLIIQLYLNRKWSMREIEKYLGLTQGYVLGRLERFGVKRRTPQESLLIRKRRERAAA